MWKNKFCEECQDIAIHKDRGYTHDGVYKLWECLLCHTEKKIIVKS